MSDVADLGSDKAAVIFDDQLSQQEDIANKNHYLIAHCSGDGELVVKPLTGSSKARKAHMGDMVTTSNWAFAQWSFKTCSAGSWGDVLAGDGEMEKKLRDYIAKNKPPRPR